MEDIKAVFIKILYGNLWVLDELKKKYSRNASCNNLCTIYRIFRNTFHCLIQILLDIQLGFPDSSVGKESACNAGDPWLDSWVGKIHWRRDRLPTPVFLVFPCGSAGKQSACNAGDLSLIPGLGRSPGEGKGYPLQYSGPDNSIDCIVHGVA